MIVVFSCKYSFIKAFSTICMYYEMIDSLQNLTLDGTDGCCFVFQIFFIKAFSNVCMYYEMIDSLQNLTLVLMVVVLSFKYFLSKPSQMYVCISALEL